MDIEGIPALPWELIFMVPWLAKLMIGQAIWFANYILIIEVGALVFQRKFIERSSPKKLTFCYFIIMLVQPICWNIRWCQESVRIGLEVAAWHSTIVILFLIIVKKKDTRAGDIEKIFD